MRGNEANYSLDSQVAIIPGTADGYGIIATKHVKSDCPPNRRGVWPPRCGEGGEEKEVFILVEASRFS